ncbi:MAG: hypothetical protein R6V11_07550 [Ectothiorhodospiraceae bacterium]
MTRLTGFIVFAAAIALAVAAIITSTLYRMPEPFAGCVDAHRQRADVALGEMHDTDLVLDEARSGVTEGDRNGTSYRRIEAHVEPAAPAAGQPVTLTCYAIGEGNDREMLLREEALRARTGDE